MLALELLSAPDASTLATGAPLLLALDSIDEDQDQPRRDFAPGPLDELAQTIAARGVRTPISVRPHPTCPGRWMLNAGARRVRASRLAGKLEIPAFVDLAFDSYDQVIENEQREALQPIELAYFVARELASGRTRAEVAQRLGKSGAYITYVCALIDPPDWLLAAYRSGRCRGVKELYDLRRLHEQNPQDVGRWLDEHETLTRHRITQLRRTVVPAALARAKAEAPEAVRPAARTTRGADGHHPPQVQRSKISATAPTRLCIVAMHGASLVDVRLDSLPPEAEHVFVSSRRDGSFVSVPILSLDSIRIRRVASQDTSGGGSASSGE